MFKYFQITDLVFIGFSLFLIVFLFTYKNREAALALLFLIGSAVFPRQLTSSGNIAYTGIAAPKPVLTVGIVTLLLFLIMSRQRFDFSPFRAFAPFVIYLLVGMFAVWDTDSISISGFLHYLVVILAIIVGSTIGSRLIDNKESLRFFVRVVFYILLLQLIVCVLQFMGVPIFSLNENMQAIMGSRVNGTLNHPNNLGKIAFILAPLAMLGLRTMDRQIKKLSVLSLIFVVSLVGFSQGRANIIAVAMLLFGFIIFNREIKYRFAVVIVAALGSIPLALTLLNRFEEDPLGGSRMHMTDIAMHQIRQSPFFGIGPNKYVDVVGKYDALTAAGLPVHNSFLLVIAEIGIIGCILFFLPILGLSIRGLRHSTGGGDRLLSVLFVVASIILFATGWGMVSTYILPLWGFVLGVLTACPTRKVISIDQSILKNRGGVYVNS